MPLLLWCSPPCPSRAQLIDGLGLIQTRFPGTFLLLASMGPPPRLPPSVELDWVSLPPDTAREGLEALCEHLARLYGAHAVLALWTKVMPEARLDRLARQLPFEATAWPSEAGGRESSVLLDRLRSHLARGGKPQALLRWRGEMGTEVIQLAERFLESGAEAVEVRLSISDHRDSWRRPRAWLALARSLMRPARGVSFRLITTSQNPKVQALVSLLNRLLEIGTARRS